MTSNAILHGSGTVSQSCANPPNFDSLMVQAILMTAFPEISKICYEGPDSDNPLAFRWYNPDEVVAGKTMKDVRRTVK